MFLKTTISASDLRNASSLLKHFENDPHAVLELERYNQAEAIVMTPQLYELLLDGMRGRVRIFSIAHANSTRPPKEVVARWVDADDLHQTIQVDVDGFAYTMLLSLDEPSTPDWSQHIWNHHEDVAHKLVELFASSERSHTAPHGAAEEE